jgi:hypothetical protein
MTSFIDFSIENITPTGTFSPGEKVAIQATIRSNGIYDGQSAFVNAYISTDTVLDEADVDLGWIGYSFNIAAGDSELVGNWPVHSVPYLAPGSYYLIGVVSSLYYSEDGPGDNNVMSVPFNIRYEPPEVSVTYNGQSNEEEGLYAPGDTKIIDNSTVPNYYDGTDFGFVFEGFTSTRTFYVTNKGSDPLTITNIVIPANFTLVEPLSTTLASGETDAFTIAIEPSLSGSTERGNFGGSLQRGTVSFLTNDADEGQFDFVIQAEVFDHDVTGDPSTTATLTLDEPTVGHIQEGIDGVAVESDEDWYSVELEAGKAYSFAHGLFNLSGQCLI